jgi:alanine racemase
LGGGWILATGRPTEAQIDLAALRANYATACRLAGGRQVIAVVKSDGYGHGAVTVTRALVEAGCPRVATATVDEGVALRDAGLGVPVLVLGGVHDAGEAAEAVARGLTPVVHGRWQLAALTEALRGAGEDSVPVHVEIDTGMRRMGVAPDDAVALLTAIASQPALRIEGVYTHLACADEPDLDPSWEQLALFRQLLAAVRARGLDPGCVHFANSAALLSGAALLDTAPSDAVRPGVMLYGARPAYDLSAELRPVMTLRTRVVALRTVYKREAVGYNATFRATRDTRVATLPVGYGDGVPVSASNRATVLIQGRRLAVVGRISMDYLGVDVGAAPVALGDEAILFGAGQGAELRVEEAAEAAGTIAYELLVRVGSRVPRVIRR